MGNCFLLCVVGLPECSVVKSGLNRSGVREKNEGRGRWEWMSDHSFIAFLFKFSYILISLLNPCCAEFPVLWKLDWGAGV